MGWGGGVGGRALCSDALAGPPPPQGRGGGVRWVGVWGRLACRCVCVCVCVCVWRGGGSPVDVDAHALRLALHHLPRGAQTEGPVRNEGGNGAAAAAAITSASEGAQ